MRWARWDKARHTLTVVAAGSTRTVLADLSPSLSVRFTAPFSLTPPVATYLYYADDTEMFYADDTQLEYA